MSDKVNISIDAMGGENSPRKIIEGIEISLKSNQENFFYLFGKKKLLEKEISKKKLIQKYSEIIDSEDKTNPISDHDLTEILIKEGIKIARRTVAKYRESLDYPVSRLRKELK